MFVSEFEIVIFYDHAMDDSQTVITPKDYPTVVRVFGRIIKEDDLQIAVSLSDMKEKGEEFESTTIHYVLKSAIIERIPVSVERLK